MQTHIANPPCLPKRLNWALIFDGLIKRKKKNKYVVKILTSSEINNCSSANFNWVVSNGYPKNNQRKKSEFFPNIF